LLLGSIEELAVDGNLLELFLGLLVALAVLAHHHLLYLFSLLDSLLQIPLLGVEGFVLLADRFDF
jgi:hypothetical protein